MSTQKNLPQNGVKEKVAGVTYDHRDDHIDPSMKGEELLVRQVNNRYDRFAVGVFRYMTNRHGVRQPVQIGFIPRERGNNEYIWHFLEDGWNIRCTCTEVYDGSNGYNKGLRIYLWDADGEPLAEFLQGVA